MSLAERPRPAILSRGDRAARDRADASASRFAARFDAFDAAGVFVGILPGTILRS